MVRTGSETSGRSETGSWPSDTAPTSTKASVAATVVTGRPSAPLARDIDAVALGPGCLRALRTRHVRQASHGRKVRRALREPGPSRRRTPGHGCLPFAG